MINENTNQVIWECQTNDIAKLSMAELEAAANTMRAKLYNVVGFNLECIGYGFFDKETLLNKFFRYCEIVLTKDNRQEDIETDPDRQIRKTNTIKLTINGFNLEAFTENLSYLLINIRSHEAENLTLNICNSEGMSLQHLALFLECACYPQIQSLTIQMGRWEFKGHWPPFWFDLMSAMEQRMRRIASETKLERCRLEISGWYYTKMDVKRLLGLRHDLQDIANVLGVAITNDKEELQQAIKLKKESLANNSELLGKVKEMEQFKAGSNGDFNLELSRFRDGFTSQINRLLGNSKINDLEIDLRNWHGSLEMKELKRRLDSLTKKDHMQKSVSNLGIGGSIQPELQLLRIVVVV